MSFARRAWIFIRVGNFAPPPHVEYVCENTPWGVGLIHTTEKRKTKAGWSSERKRLDPLLQLHFVVDGNKKQTDKTKKGLAGHTRSGVIRL